MTSFKKSTFSIFVLLLLFSGMGHSAFVGPTIMVGASVASLVASVTTGVFSVPPNKLFPNSYSASSWVVRGYDAIEESCFEGCLTRGSMSDTDTPPICFYAAYTAHVKGNYEAIVGDKNLTEAAEGYSYCGDASADAITAAQAEHPIGSVIPIWYKKADPASWTDGYLNGVYLAASVGTGILGIVFLGTAIIWHRCSKNRAAQQYILLDQAAT